MVSCCTGSRHRDNRFLQGSELVSFGVASMVSHNVSDLCVYYKLVCGQGETHGPNCMQVGLPSACSEGLGTSGCQQLGEPCCWCGEAGWGSEQHDLCPGNMSGAVSCCHTCGDMEGLDTAC